MLEVDQPAPGFELENQDGETVSLADFEGAPLVLYFYPKAGTPGCTQEACSFRDAWDEFAERDVAVVGVSTDPVEELAAFRDEHDLPFELLSDKSGAIARAYETFGTTDVDGETFEIAFRNTYVIDEEGQIAAVYEGVSPESHAREILADL